MSPFEAGPPACHRQNELLYLCGSQGILAEADPEYQASTEASSSIMALDQACSEPWILCWKRMTGGVHVMLAIFIELVRGGVVTRSSACLPIETVLLGSLEGNKSGQHS